MRFMMPLRTDENAMPADGPGAELMERMGALLDEMTAAGVLLDTAGLATSAQGTRLQLSGGRITMADGPFHEAGAAIGGYVLIRAGSQQEAAGWAERFLGVRGDAWTLTAEIRRVDEPAGAGV
ncbi:YciI family protein [Streptomyces endophytica]|uniref:YciI family protein n=1 Tax=Streptomyces endophytica TaxID=2991496 RepID=A0ABY6P781_9ACTN|nr:YciI family protein [Streptomyces endophytica]UZJ29649.1 YciI family protein [Streptomyces endophytica]